MAKHKVIFHRSIAFADKNGAIVAPAPGEEVEVEMDKPDLRRMEESGTLSFVEEEEETKAQAKPRENKSKGKAPENR